MNATFFERLRAELTAAAYRMNTERDETTGAAWLPIAPDEPLIVGERLRVWETWWPEPLEGRLCARRADGGLVIEVRGVQRGVPRTAIADLKVLR